MADRQQFFRPVKADPELTRILEASREKVASEDELKEQRISFAFGNAPRSSENSITKDSVKLASVRIRLLPVKYHPFSCPTERKTILHSTLSSKNQTCFNI